MKQALSEAERAERVQAASRRLRDCLIVLGVMCLLIPVVAAISYGWDAPADAPWGYPVFGRATLTGTWEGEFTGPGGARFAVLMDLRRAKLSNGEPHDEDDLGALVSGEASWCDDHARHAEGVVVDGAAPVFSGFNGTVDQVQLGLENAGQRVAGLQPDGFQGSWQADMLTLQPAFSSWTGSTFEYPDSRALRTIFKKPNESIYRAACVALDTTVP